MVGIPSPLTACSATLNFLDFAATLIDKVLKSNGSENNNGQEHKELDRECEKLKEIDSSNDLERTPSDANKTETENTEAERGVQKVYEKCKTLADRLVPAFQASLAKGADGKSRPRADSGKKGDLEKYKKEVESLKAECAAQLQKLMCMATALVELHSVD